MMLWFECEMSLQELMCLNIWLPDAGADLGDCGTLVTWGPLLLAGDWQWALKGNLCLLNAGITLMHLI